MKKLKPWQKAGLVAAIVTGLTLGGLTPKYNSKGLESKLSSIGMSVAEAKEDKYNIPGLPDLTGYKKQGQMNLDTDNNGSKEILVEIFKKDGEGFIMIYSSEKGIWGWGKLKHPKDPGAYSIIDSNCNKIFNENDKKPVVGEDVVIPGCYL